VVSTAVLPAALGKLFPWSSFRADGGGTGKISEGEGDASRADGCSSFPNLESKSIFDSAAAGEGVDRILVDPPNKAAKGAK